MVPDRRAAMRVLRAEAGEVLGLVFSPDARALAACVCGQGVFLWNLDAGGPPVCVSPVASERAKDVYFTPDGRGVGWLDYDGWKVYDRDARRLARPRLSDPGQIYRLLPGPGGDRVYTQHSFPQHALVGWRAAGGGGWERDWEVTTRHLNVEQLTVAPAGDRLAVLTRPATDPKWEEKRPVLELRSAATGRVLASAPYPWKVTGPLVVAPDGRHVVGLHDMTVVVWAAGDTCDPLLIRDASRKHFKAAAFDPSGRYLFAARFDGTVHVFDAAGWGCRVRFDWGVGPLRSVAVSPDATLAAAGNERGEVVVWDVDLD